MLAFAGRALRRLSFTIKYMAFIAAAYYIKCAADAVNDDHESRFNTHTKYPSMPDEDVSDKKCSSRKLPEEHIRCTFPLL